MNAAFGLRASAQRGCNLIELLILLTMLGLIMGAVGLTAVAALGRARRAETYRAMRAVEGAVVRWQDARGGRCPPSVQALARAGLLPYEPLDGWRRSLRFARCSRAGIALYSAGPDGRPHTRDDLLSWAQRDPRWTTPDPPRRRRAGPALAFLAGLVLLGLVLRRLPITIVPQAA